MGPPRRPGRTPKSVSLSSLIYLFLLLFCSGEDGKMERVMVGVGPDRPKREWLQKWVLSYYLFLVLFVFCVFNNSLFLPSPQVKVRRG